MSIRFLDCYMVTDGQTGLHSGAVLHIFAIFYERTKTFDYNKPTVEWIASISTNMSVRASRILRKLLESILNFEAHKV